MRSIVAALVVLGGAGRAWADARADLEGEMATYLSWARQPVWSADQAAKAKPATECHAAVARARKAGVKDDQELELFGVDAVMEAPKKGPHSGTRMVAVKDAGKVCDAYAKTLESATFTAAVQASYDLQEWLGLVKPSEPGATASGMGDKPRACIAAIDAKLAAGTPGTSKLKLQGAEVTLDDARAACTRTLAQAEEFQSAVNARLAAEAEKRTAKYRVAGIAGPRLELFAYYDMEWYLPGCTRSIGDPKALKKAKLLCRWRTAPDGTITIRRFAFKGDKYVQSEKSFATEAGAYRGCK